MIKPVLFITFNRLDYVKATFEKIRAAKPSKFYIASDGAREHIEGEAALVQEVRDWILKNIDWECEVKTRFLDKNSGGCAYGVSGAVTWFFENEPEGIILEDDCVPDISFFTYCSELLERYREEKNIWHISGLNIFKNFKNKDSYVFSRFMTCWGWASWADRWQHFSLDLSDYDKSYIENLTKNKKLIKIWENYLYTIQQNKSYTWDYQWALIIIKNNGLCITPTKNLISNIGITGEHYNGETCSSLYLPTFDIGHLTHPDNIKINTKLQELYEKEVDIYKNWYDRNFSIKKISQKVIITFCGIKASFKIKKR